MRRIYRRTAVAIGVLVALAATLWMATWLVKNF